MRVLISLLILQLFVPTLALADATTSIAFGCTSWGDSTLELKTGEPDRMYDITIWANGLTQLEEGNKSITINNKDVDPEATSAADSTGQARLCSSDLSVPCSVEKVTIEFTILDMDLGGDAEGAIHPEKGGPDVYFKSKISTKDAVCG